MSNEPESQLLKQGQESSTFLTETRFEDFELSPLIKAGLKDAGFIFCTPIQAEVLPISLTGRDVAGQAQTGTGKTVAFLVTVLSRLLSLPQRKADFPSALIIAPTRELAIQIYEDAEKLIRHTDLVLAQVIGGIDYFKQADNLRKGADIVICTPGRIIDYFKQGVFKTGEIKIVVIDEADRLLDLGFIRDMRYILRKLPHYEKRQSMLFSATLSYRILELTYDYMNLPEFISVTPEDLAVEGVEQILFHVGMREKLPLLLGLLEKEDWNRILIFTNTKASVEWLSQKLRGNELPAEGITGDLPQRKRLNLMERFKDGHVKILVATDVASRGIHVEDISHVINYDLPQDAENYVHRIGRTAREGKTGRALSFACEEYVYHLEPLERMLGYKIPVTWPEDESFKKDKAGPVSRRRRRTSPRSQGAKASVTGDKRPERYKSRKKKGISQSRSGTGQGPGSASRGGRRGDQSKNEGPRKTKARQPQKSRKRQRPT